MDHISQHLIPITDQVSKGLLKGNSKLPGTSDEKQFIKSLKTPQIVQRPIEDLKNVLKYIMIKTGLRGENYPVELAKDILLEHIVSKFGHHTHEEIKLAFELAIDGKLELKPDEVKHFENFSCAYFSRIMSAYRIWAAKKHKEIVKEILPEPEKEDLNNKTMQDWWNDVSKRVRHYGMKYHFVSIQLYDWAKESGLIENSGIQKSAMMKLAVESRIAELISKYKMDPAAEIKKELEDFQRMNKFSLVEAYYAEVVKTLAKRLMVYEMMKLEKDEGDINMVGGQPPATV